MAIGAPYEEGGGTVYIHLGSPEGLKETPSQIIKASDFLREGINIDTFGYSLSGKFFNILGSERFFEWICNKFYGFVVGSMDLDQNGYPDLLVGAYSSDAVRLSR